MPGGRSAPAEQRVATLEARIALPHIERLGSTLEAACVDEQERLLVLPRYSRSFGEGRAEVIQHEMAMVRIDDQIVDLLRNRSEGHIRKRRRPSVVEGEEWAAEVHPHHRRLEARSPGRVREDPAVGHRTAADPRGCSFHTIVRNIAALE